MKGPRNEEVKKAIALLEKTSRKSKKKIWKDVATRIAKPRRQRVSVNLWKIASSKIGKKFLLVPGKVLGTGKLDKAVNVIALEFSESARKKISEKGKAVSIQEALNEKIDAKDVAIFC